MSETIAEARPPRTAEIQGLVDGATDSRLLGWAWNVARPGERLTVELRLGTEPVAQAVAERERPDLAKAGIGDGCHAFHLPLRPEWSRRHAELSVVARSGDGTEAPLPMRVRRADVDPTGALQRVLEATAAAHRQLREDLHRLTTQVTPEQQARDATLARLAEGQAALDDKLETLTLWLTRLDGRLAALPAPEAPAPRRRVDAWQLALGATLALSLAGGGLFSLRWLLPG